MSEKDVKKIRSNKHNFLSCFLFHFFLRTFSSLSSRIFFFVSRTFSSRSEHSSFPRTFLLSQNVLKSFFRVIFLLHQTKHFMSGREEDQELFSSLSLSFFPFSLSLLSKNSEWKKYNSVREREKKKGKRKKEREITSRKKK